MSDEIWMDIPNRDGYQVSNLGSVRSLDMTVICNSRWGKKVEKFYKGRVLATSIDKTTGYIGTQLGRAEGYKRVHELVALTFIGERPKGLVVRHIDGNKLNNNAANLAYGTEKQNQADRKAHGTSYLHGRAGSKLTPIQVLEIRQLLANGNTQLSVANKYGISQSQVSIIKSEKHWGWL